MEKIKRQPSISVLTQLAILAAIIAFIGGEEVRRNNEVFAAWKTITTAGEQSGSGARIKALQFLNSRPWRFPYIGWTEEDWFWDKQKQKCVKKQLFGRRWKREPLAGLSAPNAYLALIHLCGAELPGANLQKAYLWGTNLQEANLWGANLQKARLSGTNLQKARLWSTNLQKADLWGANLQEARLSGANLQEANLRDANLQKADLRAANLQEADLRAANLQEVDLRAANLTPKQIKSACFWDQAIYKGGWNWDKQTKTWVSKNEQAELDNTNYIEDLKKDKSSDPEEPLDCSR